MRAPSHAPLLSLQDLARKWLFQRFSKRMATYTLHPELNATSQHRTWPQNPQAARDSETAREEAGAAKTCPKMTSGSPALCARACLCVCVCARVHVHACVHMCMHVCVCVHANTRARTYTKKKPHSWDQALTFRVRTARAPDEVYVSQPSGGSSCRRAQVSGTWGRRPGGEGMSPKSPSP